MSSTGKSSRHAFTETLLREAQADPSIFAVTSDARGSVTLGEFEKSLPAQFVEVGIAEQNAVGIGAGLARSGKRVFVCGPACFYSARSAEQVKNDVAYADVDVKIVGVSGGVSYGALGSTHHSLHDIALYRAIPNMRIILPADVRQTAQATEYLAHNSGPAYMRLGRSPVPTVYGVDEASFQFGRANLLREGTDCTIIAAGEAVYHAVKAAESLQVQGMSCTVLDVPTIKPLDNESILRSVRSTGLVVTIEEHSIFGGLGGAVAELLIQNEPVPMKIIGFPDEFVVAGESPELFEYYGLSGANLKNTIEEFIRSSSRMKARSQGA